MIEFNHTDAADPRWLQGFGGDTSNAAIAAARQGAAAGYVTALGQDHFGDSFIDLWRREGIDCAGVARRADGHTGVYFVTHDSSGHQFHFLRTGSAASRMTAADLPRDYLAGARILHISGISQAISTAARAAGFAAIDTVKAAGGRVSYDTNLRLKLWPLARALSLALWLRHGVKRVPSANPVAGGVGDHAPAPALDRLPRSLRHERRLPAHASAQANPGIRTEGRSGQRRSQRSACNHQARKNRRLDGSDDHGISGQR